jgi:hypothetical protein
MPLVGSSSNTVSLSCKDSNKYMPNSDENPFYRVFHLVI